MKEIYIVGASRTALGSFLGNLKNFSAFQLGEIIVEGMVKKYGISPDWIDEVYFNGIENIAKTSNLKISINPVKENSLGGFSSIEKAISRIQRGEIDVAIAGSVQKLPVNNPKTEFLFDNKFFDEDFFKLAFIEGEKNAKDKNITRKKQNQYTIQSLKNEVKASIEGLFDNEIIPVYLIEKELEVKRDEIREMNIGEALLEGEILTEKGKITEYNISPLSEGAGAVIFMSGEAVERLGVSPLARVISMSNLSGDMMFFRGVEVLRKAIEKAGLGIEEIDYFEIEEIFALEALLNIALLNLNRKKVNVNGGSLISGYSGVNASLKKLVTLINVLQQNAGEYGVLATSEGKTSSAMVIENLQ